MPITLPPVSVDDDVIEPEWGNAVRDALSAILNQLCPVGSMMPFAGSVEPAMFLFCRGQAISRTTYASLFAAIGTAYGAGDGSTTFNLPNLQARGLVGTNVGTPDSPALAGKFSGGLGEKVGTTDLVVPVHSHGVNIWSSYIDANHNHYAPNIGTVMRRNPFAPIDNVNVFGMRVGDGFQVTVDSFDTSNQLTGTENQNHRHAINGTSDNAGVSGVNQNLPPTVSVNFIIRALLA